MMTVTLAGTPDNFKIETKASEYENETTKIGLSTILLGGGYIVYSSVKIREELEKLEQGFWATIEESIAALSKTGTD
jgi:hypothetical protein